jgi:hypothetical protein
MKMKEGKVNKRIMKYEWLSPFEHVLFCRSSMNYCLDTDQMLYREYSWLIGHSAGHSVSIWQTIPQAISWVFRRLFCEHLAGHFVGHFVGILQAILQAICGYFAGHFAGYFVDIPQGIL